MKRLIVGIVCLWSLFPLYSTAQRGGGGGARGGGGGFHGGGAGFRGGGAGFRGGAVFRGGDPLGAGIFNGSIRSGFNGIPPVGPIPPLGSFPRFDSFRNFNNFNQFRNFNQFGRRGNGGNGGDGFFPFGYADTGYYDDGQQGPVIVLPPQDTFVPFPPPPPRPPPQPELHEYSWTETGSDPSAVFTIVSKDGNSHAAVAVWVQGNTVRYFTPDGTAARMPLDSVNRAATRTANVAKNLTLALPAEASGRR